jgi:hypothetical protein
VAEVAEAAAPEPEAAVAEAAAPEPGAAVAEAPGAEPEAAVEAAPGAEPEEAAEAAEAAPEAAPDPGTSWPDLEERDRFAPRPPASLCRRWRCWRCCWRCCHDSARRPQTAATPTGRGQQKGRERFS